MSRRGWLLLPTMMILMELSSSGGMFSSTTLSIALAMDNIHFANGEHVTMPQIDDLWLAFTETFHKVWQVIGTGLVLCPGNGEDVKSSFDGERLILETPCRFCDYDVLCGRRFSV